MKTVIAATALITMLSTSVIFGQAKAYQDEIPNVSFCGAMNQNDKIRYSDLENCDEVLQPYKELKIKSFTLAYMIPSPEGKGGVFVDFPNTGGKLNQQTLDALKTLKDKNVKKIMIEAVVVLEANGTERKMKGINISLE
ncbi:MAG: hypothetical protein V4608_14575 [Bacteroidota bacterium]